MVTARLRRSCFVNHNDFTCETLAFIQGQVEYASNNRPSTKLLAAAAYFGVLGSGSFNSATSASAFTRVNHDRTSQGESIEDTCVHSRVFLALFGGKPSSSNYKWRHSGHGN